MITLKELNQHGFPTTPEIDDNLNKLLTQINKIRAAYAVAMTVSSGLRSDSFNASTPGAAKNSAHCVGLAVDIADPDGKLMQWVIDNLQLVADCGFHIEDFNWCPNWVHFGLRAPSSGKRIFIPNAHAPLVNRWNGEYDHSLDL